MDFIYRRAYLTLVVADGENCNSGISSTQPRLAIQMTATIANLAIGTVFLSVKYELLRSKWASRVWTLQEYALSFRTLIFTPRQIFFSCADGLFREDVCGQLINGLPREKRYLLPIVLGFNLANRLPIDILTEVYTTLVSTFFTRKITLSQDVLKAFSGILGALTPYLGGFRRGLPEEHVAFSVCWCASDTLRRRPDFPSWSWAGWEPSHGNGPLGKLTGIRYLDAHYATNIEIASPMNTASAFKRHGCGFFEASGFPDREAYVSSLPGPRPTKFMSKLSLHVIYAMESKELGRWSIASCKATLEISDMEEWLYLQKDTPHSGQRKYNITTLSTTLAGGGNSIPQSRVFHCTSSCSGRLIYGPRPQSALWTQPIDLVVLAYAPSEVVVLPVKWTGEVAQRTGNSMLMSKDDWFGGEVEPCNFYLE